MTNAQFIFNSMTKLDMINVVAFMEENKTASLATTLNWLYEIVFVDGEDCIFEREHDVSYASHVRQCRIDIYTIYGWDNIDEIPF